MSRDYTRSDRKDSRYVEQSTPGGASDRQIEQPDRSHSSEHHAKVDNHTSPSPAHMFPARSHDSRSTHYTRSRHAYREQRERMQEDIRNLARQGLIRQKTCAGPDANPRERLTLTKEGSKLLRTNRFLPEDQAAYYGFVKPTEANHNADISRLYQKEITKILDQGGRNPRVVLDFELKKNLNRGTSPDLAPNPATRSLPGMASRSCEAKSPFPTFLSTTKPETANPPVSTWNW